MANTSLRLASWRRFPSTATLRAKGVQKAAVGRAAPGDVPILPRGRASSFWAKAFYQSYRERGGSHQAALRALAFKWIRVLHRCWLDRKPYDEARYLMALQKRQAPLLAFAAKASS